MPNASSVLFPGQEIGGCRIIRMIGRGGMGEVYLAEHLSLKRPVALKTLRPDLRSTDRVERFLREAILCARIDHPNVVTIHNVGDEDGLYYIVMQYVQGRNLAQLVREHEGPLPWRSVLRIIQLAATGLQAVHNQDLVHRDVKPTNIMLAKDSRVLLMDFGLVGHAVDSSIVEAGRPIGTPPFMSPEQCRGEALDCRSDIFSLGSTFYCLLTGREPFQGSHVVVMERIAAGSRPEPIQHFNWEVPADVSNVVARAMAPRPADRFATASDMARAVKKSLAASMIAPTPMWKTAPVAAAGVETPIKAEPLEELLPLRSRWETTRDALPWIGIGVGILSLVGLILLLVAVVVVTGMRNGTNPGPAPLAPKGDMVRVESGYAQLGCSTAKVREFLADYLEDDRLDQAVEMVGQEIERRVEVPAFWIDRYEVTNAEYAEFLRETGREPPEHFEGGKPPAGKLDHPVVNVCYDDAEAYAHWAGKELPTREQWMRAFRGDEDKLFPWGDQYDAGRTNVGDNPKHRSTSPIKDTPGDISPYGVYNMVGNASEMLRGTTSQKDRVWRVAKGAEYKLPGFIYGIGSCQYFYRPLDFRERGVGFRCVREER